MIFNDQEIQIKEIAVHKVGNKAREEECFFSKKSLQVNEEVKELLSHYFLKPFRSMEYYHLHHEGDVALNPIYRFVEECFENHESFFENSIKIAKNLFEVTTNSKVKSGEFYVVHFSDMHANGEVADAIGIFKSENKETFLKVYPDAGNMWIDSDEGIDINKLDKGCLIMNVQKEDGYLVSIVDTVSKGNEARFWKEDFLGVVPRQDEYFKTEHMQKLCKSFITDELPDNYKVSKVDQAELLNRSASFFKNNDTYNEEVFAEEVIKNPVAMDSFKEFNQRYQEEMDVVLDKEFAIAEPAVKKQQGIFKSVIKLDKNFHVYIHGNRKLVERGFDDEKGMNFYTLYFNSEE